MKQKDILKIALPSGFKPVGTKNVITPLLMVLLLLWGCEPSNPGSPLENQPPETRIIVAPLEGIIDTVYTYVYAVDTTVTPPETLSVDTLIEYTNVHDHYISPSRMFRVQWFGHDRDGLVKGFYIQVDDGPEVWTVRGDSAISFEALTPDPLIPGGTIPTQHRIRITAVDNEDLRDPTPAERVINVINSQPVISEFIADFSDSSIVGPGIGFEIEWNDLNISGCYFRVTIDGNAVTEWDANTKFRFCNLDDPSIPALLENDVTSIDINLLTIGEHNLGVEIKDWGGALGDPLIMHITVQDTILPTLEGIETIYGASAYYPDGSIFYRANTTTAFTMIGSASEYHGNVHSYRYRYRYQPIPATPADSAWAEWHDWTDWRPAAFEMTDLTVGEYQFQALCRDWTGTESPVLNYIMSIVEVDFSEQTLLIVDETKSGNGRPGSPNNEQCDEFYRTILEVDTSTWETPTGWQVTEIDYASHKVNDASYISARDVFNKKVIIWHSDDKAQYFISDNIRLLVDYLERGGKLIISGWDVLKPFGGADNPNEITFDAGFAYKYLRIQGGTRSVSGTRDSFIGMLGNTDSGFEYPDSLTVDSEKIPGSWNGPDKCWVLLPRHRTESVGKWIGFNPDDVLNNGDACLRNFNPVNPWRTIVLGFPLYFMKNDEAKEFIGRALVDISG